MPGPIGPPDSRRRGALSILAFGALLVGGCSREPQVFQAVHRFTDPDSLSRTWSNIPVPPKSDAPAFQVLESNIASIANDSRAALTTPPYAMITWAPKYEVPADGVVDAVRPVPPVLGASDEILVMPLVKLPAVLPGVSPFTVKAEPPGPGKPFKSVHMKFTLPEEARGRKADVSLFGLALNWPKLARTRTPVVRIPAEARLESAIGVLNPANSATSVSFTINACEGESCRPIFTEKFDSLFGQGDVPWRTVKADLATFAGRDVSFEFVSQSENEGPTSRVFPLWGNPTVYAPREGKAPGVATNVILLSLDTMAAGHMSVYGYARDTTPKMKEWFGDGGTVFESCMSMATATPPSHMTMFTGLFPLEHGVTNGLKMVDPDIVPIASRIRAAGMETAAFTEDGWLSIQLGFGEGFDTFAEDRSPDFSIPVGRVQHTFGLGREWISANRDKPFFLFLHTFQVHDPYAPPAAYVDKIDGAPLAEDAGIPPALAQQKLAYDREIRLVDDQLDLLMKGLEAAGIAERTLVIVVSDHGEAFGEHGWIQHSNYAHEEVLHVPLLMKGPGVKASQRVTDVVSHVDIAPTILEMLGVPMPGLHRGKSLAANMAGTATAHPDRVVFAESWGTYAKDAEGNLQPFTPPGFVARRGALKLARYQTADGPRYEAYDLAADPGEKENLADRRAADFAELRSILDGYEEVATKAREARLQGKAVQSEDVQLAPDQEQKLRSLGYLQ